MSTGAFILSKYEDNLGTIRPILIQPETAAADFGGTTNDPPAGAVTAGTLRAKARKGAREYGLGARRVSVRLPASPAGGYLANSTLSIPILQQSVFDGIGVTDTCDYAGNTCVVVSKSDEDRL